MEEVTAGFGDIEWKTSRIRRRKDKGSDLAIHAEECFEVETLNLRGNAALFML